MLYKFKSKATADLIMLAPNGDALLRALGRAPTAKGIIEVADMPAARAAIERAVAEDEARRLAAEQAADQVADPALAQAEARSAEPAQPVALRQRLWPMVEMLRRAEAAGQPVVWGV